ncbi:MAG: CehA/McbA family metallohydrolase, partial [Firmicutes bacterium]|nr:CehA/McbA family metallohydrolase [Bacillota bacterium]
MYKKFSRSICFMLAFTLIITNLFSFGMGNVAQAASEMSVAEALTEPHGTEVTVKGYIVAPVNTQYAVKIADVNDAAASEHIVVKLETDMRADYSPVNNPEALGKQITATGIRDTYSGEESIEQVNAIQFVDDQSSLGLEIQHTPIASSNANEAIAIDFDLTYDGNPTVAESVYASVYYKPSSGTDFDLLDANKGGGSFGAVIPAAKVTEDIAYYIEAGYQGKTARVPETGIHTITVAPQQQGIITIAEARGRTEGEVTVQGYVTCTDGGKVFIEDETAGINLYNQIDETSFREGDLVKVTGSISEYKGLKQMKDYTVEVSESKNTMPTPHILTSLNQNWEDYESELVLVKGVTLETLNTAGITTISDGGGSTVGIYQIPSQAGAAEGDKVDILAVVSCFDTHQLHVRRAEDVTLSVSEDYMTLAEARAQTEGTAVTARGIVTHAESDTLIYIQDGTAGIKIDAYGSGGLAAFNVGDLVKVTGEVGSYRNELQVVKNDISSVGTGFTLPEAKTIDIKDLDYYQGQFITLPLFKITGIDDYNLSIEDKASDATKIYHGKAENFDYEKDCEIGDWYSVKGIAAIYNDEQVKLLDGADLIEQEAPLDPDALLPIIFDTVPANMASVFSQDVQISAQIEKTVDDIDTASIKLYLNEELLSHTENNLTVTANVYGLSYGDHDVKLEVSDVKGQTNTEEWYFTVQDPDAEYNFYFGIPHAHTSYSDGKGTPTEAFEYAKARGLDWLFITDHSNWLDGVRYKPQTSELASNADYKANYELNAAKTQYEEKEGSEWYRTRIEVEAFNASNEDFLAMRGFEMTFGDVGHINVIDSEAYVEAKSQMSSLSDFYDWVENLSEAQEEEALAAFNHPNWPSDSFNNQAYIPELDREFSMMEVGNGAPPYSYSRSEEQFIRALDNGWHLGATNAQDNHSTNWGDPDNLTAVVAKSLSEEDVKEAMRNRRVYSTETRNLELTVKANGHWMGSVVEVAPGETLDFEIEATDHEEPISKLQIMTNGGAIIGEKTFNPSATVTWSPSLEAPDGAQWYMVKVIHENGKWGTASPIYTPEADSDVKFTKLEVDPETTLPGYETELKATVSNMGVRSVQNIEVTFYYDSVKEANVIATATIDSIAAGDNAKAEVTWTPEPERAGETKIIAKMTEIPGVTTVTEISKTINIVKANGKTVMIDDAHDNYDVTGGIGELIDLLRQYGYTVTINEDTITEQTLTGVDVLIITKPETGEDLTPDEDTAVGDWVRDGGSLFVTNKSNYSDDPTMLNSLLEAAGTEIRFNDDNVYEPEDSEYYSGGMVWSVYAYNLPETESKLNENMEGIRIFSGCSLVNSQGEALTNHAGTGLEILLGGNKTSYNHNVGGKTGSGHEYNKEGDLNGEAIPIIAKEEVGSGKIVAAGRHPFSDYEIVNDVSNTALTVKLIDYLAGYDRIRSIKEVREDYDKGVLKEGDIVTVKGTATVDEETFFDVLYIQDETSGICLYGSYQDNPADVSEGIEVMATGKIKVFEGEMEIQYDDFDTAVLYIGFDRRIEPKAVTTKEAMAAEETGKLIRTAGTVTEINEAGSYFKIDDGSGEAYIHVDGYVGADMGKYRVGDSAVVTGIASVGSAGPRIRVRGDSDLEVGAGDNRFYIIHTNDIHGRVEEGKYAGMGLAKIATKIKALKNERPGRVLVLDAGDTIHGQTIVQLSDGEAIIDIMNEMGYDAMTAGNHDFNYGQDRLVELDAIADFPILAANVYKDAALKERLLSPYIIKEMGGQKIGIFGLATPETTYKTHPDNVAGLVFRDPVQEAQEMA